MAPSIFTWLDYSERDRRRALDVVDLFRESGTVDELGVGSIRDGFSDLFFPGTSTIQTRACYFLVLPWTFLRMERMRIPSSEAEARARREELKLNAKLREGEDTAGVFGVEAGWALKRLPSLAYWGGLASWGIRLFPGFGSAYFRSLDGFYRQLESHAKMPVDPEGRRPAPANWHPHLPEPPRRFPYEVSVRLRPEDAAYLGDRIQARHAGSLLAALVSRAEVDDLAVEWPWELSGLAGLSSTLRRKLRHARLFAVVLHGAALLYNLMLAELRNDPKRITQYEGALESWATDVAGVRDELDGWDLAEVWAAVRGAGRPVGVRTQAFVQRWVDDVRAHGARSVWVEGSPARRLVRDREIHLKRGRARLASARHLELWGGGSGVDRMNYRWPGTKVILRDIIDGLARTEGDARDA